MKNLFLLTALTLVSLPAHAAFYCRDPGPIRGYVQDCENNEYVTESAILCLEKIEAEVKAAQSAVQSTTSGNNSRAKKSQVGKQANAEKNYNFSKEKLDALIKQANIAMDETIYFETLLAKPEDYDQPEITGKSPAAYLKSVPCYQENKELIASVLQDIDYVIFDLEHARDMAEDLGGATGGNQIGLDSTEDTMRALKNSGKIPAGPVEDTPKRIYRPSDISGTKPTEDAK